jgi:hypothetical protein
VNYLLTITPRPGFLHATVTGPNTRENVEGYLQKVLHECVARGCSNVLVEERLEGPRLQIVDIFEIEAPGSARARGKLAAIAYVDVNAEGDRMRFAEDVAANRGLRVGVFPTIAAGEAWLMQWVSQGTREGT